MKRKIDSIHAENSFCMTAQLRDEKRAGGGGDMGEQKLVAISIDADCCLLNCKPCDSPAISVL